MNLFVLLVLLFAVSEAVLTVVQFLLRKRSFKPAVRVVLIVCKLLLAIAFAVLVLAGPVQLRVVQPLMMAAYVALFADGYPEDFREEALVWRRKGRFPCVRRCVSCVRDPEYADRFGKISYHYLGKAEKRP